MRKSLLSITCALVLLGIVASPSHSAAVLPLTRVFLNGIPTPVWFNDGDSFRISGGPMDGGKTRLAGFNTLESFGPVHQWGTWHPFELYVVSKMATYNARRGVWHCSSDLALDTYGRTLWECPDLIIDDVRKGLAHVMSVDDEPANIAFIRAQRRAIAERRGIWAHGVPDFILTSAHSADEDPTRDHSYNRLVSTIDGHSEPWEHDEVYDECETLCHDDVHVEEARVTEVAMRLREDAAVRAALEGVDNLHLSLAVSMYARTDGLPTWMTAETKAALEPRLREIKASGAFGTLTTVRGACHVYVPFDRRFGITRASCLRH